ncbi:MAG: hypothetical protein ACT4PN_11995 [Nitrospiraceae bacterium]
MAINESQMTIAQQNIRDITFIVSEIHRLSAMSAHDLRTFMRRDQNWGYHIPHPEGSGLLPCGSEAYFKIGEISKRYLVTQGDLDQRIDQDRFRNAVTKELLSRFLKEERQVNERQVAKMLAAAIKTVKKRIYDLTHFVPCVVFLDKVPDQFEIGSVRFIWMKDFLKDNSEMITSRDPELVRRDVIPYYSRFPWVAQVTVPQCDEPTSFLRASATIEGALDALRLLIGKSYTARFRQAHTSVTLSESASLRRDSTGQIGFSINREWQDRHAPDKWYEKLRQQGDHYLALIGNTLISLQDPPKASHLTQRFLDSLNWYGQAVKEDNSGAAIVKYVAALERMTITKRQKNNELSKTLCHRIALLSSEGQKQRYEIQHALAKEIYDFRSALMHGSLSPSQNKLTGPRAKAEKLTRFTLLAGLDFFAAIDKGQPRAKAADLEFAYQHLSVET